MVQREGHRVDALEILGIEHMLPSGLAAALDPEIAGEGPHHRVEHGDARHAEAAAALLESAAQRIVHDGEHDDAGMLRDAGEHLVDMADRAHERPMMLMRLDALELGDAGARDAVDRLARRVGDEMEMERARRPAVLSVVSGVVGHRVLRRDRAERAVRRLGITPYRAGKPFSMHAGRWSAKRFPPCT